MGIYILPSHTCLAQGECVVCRSDYVTKYQFFYNPVKPGLGMHVYV